MNKCKTCKHFTRGKFHSSYGGGSVDWQYTGTCLLLSKVLKIHNPSLMVVTGITITDSFGCVFHAEDTNIDPEQKPKIQKFIEKSKKDLDKSDSYV